MNDELDRLRLAIGKEGWLLTRTHPRLVARRAVGTTTQYASSFDAATLRRRTLADTYKKSIDREAKLRLSDEARARVPKTLHSVAQGVVS